MPLAPLDAPLLSDSPPQPLLQVAGLSKYYPIQRGLFSSNQGQLRALHNVSFELYSGEVLGVVGESGCGKSTLAKCLTRLLEPTAGTALFQSEDWFALKGAALKAARRNIQMVFQNPYSSLNPKMTVEAILREPLQVFRQGDAASQLERIKELLTLVRLSEDSLERYPNAFSGGQRQRIGIARALALNPALIIADEPVSALDVSVQAQILNLFQELRDALGLTLLFIAHNLSVVHHVCDRVMVMYMGEVVELAPVEALFESPQHPYTQALLAAMPAPDPTQAQQKRTPSQSLHIGMPSLASELPNPMDVPKGCAFHPRCPLAEDRCKASLPPFVAVAAGHFCRCHLVASTDSTP